ncbi:sigma-70 family RNA polymerase sigma factor [Ruminococcus sp. FC2018]|uniref:sigma-70 family RNA polymerase sigma factor n=1 Tax=Ruminococcus sp. FC2018 TaxID=1410617 RepID=UPI0004903642|nr:sigma-70 family RNA polymerase sigma factor [Ruminococcus sp. FC2018]
MSRPLAEENLGLVHLCAGRFKNRGIEYDELFSAGCVGLLKAVKAFDSDRGVLFSTYAVPVILGEIKRLFRDGGTVKVSRGTKELSLKLTRMAQQYTLKNGCEPTVSQLAQLCGESEERVVEALNASAAPLSLTAENDDGTRQTDIPVDAPDECIVERLALKQALSGLEKKDRQLIYLRYFKELTQTQTAQMLGMTQVQVSRREKKLLCAIREQMDTK